MSLNNYIVSGSGFLKSVTFDIDAKKHVFEWTHLIREALPFKSKAAHSFISKHSLSAFVWNPFAEEPTRNKWRVVRRRDYYSFINEEKHEVLEWRPEKVIMESKTDVKFLNTRDSEIEELYNSFEEAEKVAKEKNEAMLEELQNKITSMTHE